MATEQQIRSAARLVFWVGAFLLFAGGFTLGVSVANLMVG